MYLMWQLEHKTIAQDIEAACAVYQERFGQPALVVLLPESFKDRLAGLALDGIEITISAQVARANLWVGRQKPE